MNTTIKNKKYSLKLTKKNSCAPGKGNQTTCFDKKSLYKIAFLWNKKNPTDKIKITDNNI